MSRRAVRYTVTVSATARRRIPGVAEAIGSTPEGWPIRTSPAAPASGRAPHARACPSMRARPPGTSRRSARRRGGSCPSTRSGPRGPRRRLRGRPGQAVDSAAGARPARSSARPCSSGWPRPAYAPSPSRPPPPRGWPRAARAAPGRPSSASGRSVPSARDPSPRTNTMGWSRRPARPRRPRAPRGSAPAGRQQPAGHGAAGIEEVERDAGPVPGHARAARSRRAPRPRRRLDRHAGDDDLPGVGVVDADERSRRSARGTSPSSMANGPTADEMLPQLPRVVDDRRASTSTWRERVVDVRVGPAAAGRSRRPWRATRSRRRGRRAAGRTDRGCRARRGRCGRAPRRRAAGRVVEDEAAAGAAAHEDGAGLRRWHQRRSTAPRGRASAPEAVWAEHGRRPGACRARAAVSTQRARKRRAGALVLDARRAAVRPPGERLAQIAELEHVVALDAVVVGRVVELERQRRPS